jgi:putative beta-galactosidase
MRIVNSLNLNWFFSKGEVIYKNINDINFEVAQAVDLPYTYNAFDGQDGGNNYYKGKASYVKKVLRPDVPKDYDIYIEFKGVNSVADVYADREHLLNHKGGYSTFRVNLTKAFENKDFLIITVVVDNKNRSDVYPQMADFTFYGGIYRDVNLISVSKTHFSLDFYGADGVSITSKLKGETAIISVNTYITNPELSDMVQVQMKHDEVERIYEVFMPASEVTKLELFIDDPKLWQGIESPDLYDVNIRLIRHNEVLDSLELKHGIREYKVEPRRGFILNGDVTPLRGVSKHQDRLFVGNAVSYDDLCEDADLIAEMGANTVRLAHYQHDQDFYDLCDEYGFVVWAEIPFISVMNKDKNAHENAINQMKELIYQSYNHPSICFWGISNEITIGGDVEGLYENLCELNDLVKKIDPTRLSTMAQVSMLPMMSKQNLITDVVSYNLYFGWYGGDFTQNEEWLDKFHKMHPNRPIGLSEYGCEGIISWHSDEPKCKDYTEEYQALYHEHMAKIIEERPYLWATHIWNMFDFGCDARDEGGVKGRNNKGMVTFDRKIKKDAFYLYKAYWSDDYFAHITGKRYALRHQNVIDIKVYSNMDSIILFVNGEEIGISNANKVHIFKDVKLRKGSNYVTVTSNFVDTILTETKDIDVEEIEDFFENEFEGEMELDSAVFTLVEEPYAGYIKPIEEDEQREGVKNWFEDVNEEEETPELTFKEGYFSINDLIGDILAHEKAGDVLVDALNAFGSVRVKRSMLGMMEGLTLKDMSGMFAQDDNKSKTMLAWTNFKLQEIKK